MLYNPENKEHILIYKKFFKEFGKTKNYEFRKLSKGITSGKKYFFDPETFEYLGTATLKTVALNPILNDEEYTDFYVGDIEKERKIDKDTYKFVKEKYIDKNIEFIVYEITNPKRRYCKKEQVATGYTAGGIKGKKRVNIAMCFCNATSAESCFCKGKRISND